MVSDDDLVMVGGEGDGVGVKWGWFGWCERLGTPRGERYWSGQLTGLQCVALCPILYCTNLHILIMACTALTTTLQFCTLLHCSVLHKMHIMHCTGQLCCIFRCFSGCHNKKLGWFQFNLPKNEPGVKICQFGLFH